MTNRDDLLQRYQSMLSEYVRQMDEKNLYQGHKFSHNMIEQNVSPEEVVSLHIEVMSRMFPELDKELMATFDFLLEVMIGYGFAYREHQSLRDRQQQLDLELEVASNVQQSLLVGEVPEMEELDIGVVSRPAKKMSGDYYHFVEDDNGRLSVAVADIIGKGIPAALSMSMIKYAMDSVPEQRMKPPEMLKNLNRVVEQNVDASMFITMFYGIYDVKNHQFFYSSAGHEPGFYYSYEKGTFEELEARGLVLGASKHTNYDEYNKGVQPGDMIVLLSDGVTECKTEKGFIERKEIIDMIDSRLHMPASEIVESIYSELERLQDFELRDDFTLLIIRRNV